MNSFLNSQLFDQSYMYKTVLTNLILNFEGYKNQQRIEKIKKKDTQNKKKTIILF